MKENKTLYKIAKAIYSKLLKIIYKPTVKGTENIPEKGAIIFVGNHKHAFDPIMVMSNTNRIVHYMAKETLFKIAEYADKQKKQAVIRAIIFFGLEMVCCGITLCAGCWVLSSNGQVSAGYAVIPMIFTFVFSVALIINAKDYVVGLQRNSRY